MNIDIMLIKYCFIVMEIKMPSFLSALRYSQRTQYKFYGHGADFVSTPNASGGGNRISHKYPQAGKYKDRILTMVTSEAGPADALRAVMYKSDLLLPDLNHPSDGYYDEEDFDFTKTSENLQNIVSESPIIVADLNYPSSGYAGFNTPNPDNSWANMPKFFFNSQFIAADDAEKIAVENLKDKESYKLNSFFQFFAPSGDKWQAENTEWHAIEMLDCVKRHQANAEKDKKEALFVLVGNQTIINFRQGIDHMLEYVDGVWSTIDPVTRQAHSLLSLDMQ